MGCATRSFIETKLYVWKLQAQHADAYEDLCQTLVFYGSHNPPVKAILQIIS